MPEIVEGFVLLRRGENPTRVLDGIHEKVDELNTKILPKGMKIEPFYDRSRLVEHTLGTVHHNLLFGALLDPRRDWLFLRTLRGSLIVVAVIPLALLGAFIGLHAIGLPANLISMGAIDFGILVDGAVVLVEHVMHESASTSSRRTGARRCSAHRACRGRRGAADVLRDGDHHRGADPGVHAAARRRPHLPAARAHLHASRCVGALVFALTLGARALRDRRSGRATRELDEPRWIERLQQTYRRVARPRARATRRSRSARGRALVVAGGLAASQLGTEFLPELDEGDFVIFVEMPPSIAHGAEASDLLVDVRQDACSSSPR